ncbi:trifunctional purine biosynthetic protein adenosine-3-like [Engystomops pustulosus]|uniref:trifunctional purine biosynthetic protein adenosine-3-like n=1 Tax=Engystomops pustulosus TaxID=76066 RepID=UPI003AFB1155
MASPPLPMGDGVTTWGEMIMNSTMVVSPPVLHALQCGKVSACVPITEGGLVGSILHYLPEHMGIIIGVISLTVIHCTDWIPDALCWKVPAIVSWLYKEGELSEEELVYHFNCGLGAVLIAQKNEAQKTLAEIQHEEEAWMIGSVLQRHEDLPHVQVRNFLEALKLNSFQLLKNVILHKAPAKISKAAVLISTAGPKLKLVMDTIRQLGSCVRLSLVISNKSAVEELKKAAGAGIPTRVIDHTMFGCHSEFERVICKVLEEFSIDLICIAGFGRILSGQFPMRWRGKILKLYSSLFPSMKIDKSSTTGSKVRGCTMCFLLDGNIPGPSILQETFTAESEGAMEDAEERAVAKALHLVASGGVTLGPDGCVSWISGDWTHK